MTPSGLCVILLAILAFGALIFIIAVMFSDVGGKRAEKQRNEPLSPKQQEALYNRKTNGFANDMVANYIRRSEGGQGGIEVGAWGNRDLNICQTSISQLTQAANIAAQQVGGQLEVSKRLDCRGVGYGDTIFTITPSLSVGQSVPAQTSSLANILQVVSINQSTTPQTAGASFVSQTGVVRLQGVNEIAAQIIKGRK